MAETAVDLESLRVEYEATQKTLQEASNRTGELTQKALRAPLTEREELEQLRLERRVRNLQPMLTRLEKEISHEQVEVDIADVTARWKVLVQKKQDAYTSFVTAIGILREALYGITAVHAAQEAEVQRLPRPVQERLGFADIQSQKHRMATRMPDSMAWQQLLCGTYPLALPNMEGILDVDAGCRELNPIMLERFLQEMRAHG